MGDVPPQAARGALKTFDIGKDLETARSRLIEALVKKAKSDRDAQQAQLKPEERLAPLLFPRRSDLLQQGMPRPSQLCMPLCACGMQSPSGQSPMYRGPCVGADASEGDMRRGALEDIFRNGAYGPGTAPMMILGLAWLTNQWDKVQTRWETSADGIAPAAETLVVVVSASWVTPTLSFDRLAWLTTQVQPRLWLRYNSAHCREGDAC